MTCKKLLICLTVMLTAVACQRSQRFTISGKLEGLDSDTVIYLEQLTLPLPTLLDSATIHKSSGKIRFRAPRPEYPELYQLRMGRQRLIFAIDSTEHIHFRASADSLFMPQEFKGSEHSEQIAFLRRSVRRLDSLTFEARKKKSATEQLKYAISEHKDTARSIIFANPRSIVAYYAVFQQVNGLYIFNPYDRADRSVCAAVATAYHAFMPHYYRSSNIYNLVLDAIESERRAQSNNRLHEFISNSGKGYIDITLNDANGVERRLSDIEGKPILLVFSVITAENGGGHILDLRDIATRFASSGLQIYQVCLDKSELLWKQACKSLPWTCVRDADGRYANLYNVYDVPTTFLIDKSGNIAGRDMTMRDMESVIKAHR